MRLGTSSLITRKPHVAGWLPASIHLDMVAALLESLQLGAEPGGAVPGVADVEGDDPERVPGDKK